MKIIIWKTIEKFPNYMISTDGKIFSKNKNKILNEYYLKHKGKKTYATVSLSNDKGIKRFLRHRLVAEVFIPNDDTSKNEVNHINGNKLDNRVENLEWVNRTENIKHAWENKLYSAKHRMKKVKCIDKNTNIVLKIYKSSYEAARELKINQGNISNCANGTRKTAGGFKWEF